MTWNHNSSVCEEILQKHLKVTKFLNRSKIFKQFLLYFIPPTVENFNIAAVLLLDKYSSNKYTHRRAHTHIYFQNVHRMTNMSITYTPCVLLCFFYCKSQRSSVKLIPLHCCLFFLNRYKSGVKNKNSDSLFCMLTLSSQGFLLIVYIMILWILGNLFFSPTIIEIERDKLSLEQVQCRK